MTVRRNTLDRSIRMQDALIDRALTFDQLAEVGDLSKTAVQRWINSMVRDKVHIEDYADDARGRKFVPMWRWGSGPDAARPGPRQTPAERMAAVRARRMNNGDLFG